MNKVRYKTVEEDTLPKYQGQILKFYNHYFPEESNQKIVSHSSVFFLALEGDLVIGCCRLLTDYSRNGILFDLIVWKERRNKGIGSQLVKNALEFCKRKGIKKLYLMTDPRYKWLKVFYQNLGFDAVKNQVLLKIEN